MSDFVDAVVVIALGSLVGAGELISRYRDAPSQALKTPPAVTYVLLNATAAIVARGILNLFDVNLGFDAATEEERIRWMRVITAGVGAMVILRSSLFIVRVGNQDVDVGPAGFLQVLLDAADRAVDRLRGAQRADRIEPIMHGVVYEKAEANLPAMCLALMQNMSLEDQQRLGLQVAQISTSDDMDDRTKTLTLGLHLMSAVGEDVLRKAVDQLGDSIRDEPLIEDEVIDTPIGGVPPPVPPAPEPS